MRILIALLGLLLLAALAACNSDTGSPTLAIPNTTTYQGIPANRTTLGAPGAPVQIITWGDFQ